MYLFGVQFDSCIMPFCCQSRLDQSKNDGNENFHFVNCWLRGWDEYDMTFIGGFKCFEVNAIALLTSKSFQRYKCSYVEEIDKVMYVMIFLRSKNQSKFIYSKIYWSRSLWICLNNFTRCSGFARCWDCFFCSM